MNSDRGAKNNPSSPWLGLAAAFIACVVALSCSRRSDSTTDSPASGGFTSAPVSGGMGGSTASGGVSSSIASGGTLISVGSSGAPMQQQTDCVTSCLPPGGQWCGVIGDKCGGQIECPPCPGDSTCENGSCIGGPSCQRLTCTNGDTHYCGTIGDACGGKLDCGDCPNGGVCGGAGLPNLCAVPNCTPKTCTDAASGANYCGDIGDGCGGILHCGDCQDGKECGSDGIANVCPGFRRCERLQCTVAMDACPADSPTTLTGTVYDPAGKLPLYNALVYVPNDPLPLPPIQAGATCEQCAAFADGTPITAALTDVNGHFTLKGVPSGDGVPLVIQVGKWRREVKLDVTVNKCTENALTNPDLTRLPRTQSEGNIPRIAVTTGSYDALECLLRRIGIADSEFTTDSSQGRVHMYVGGRPDSATGSGGASGAGGAAGVGGRTGFGGPAVGQQSLQGASQFAPALGGAKFPHATTLWSDPNKLQGYDILMLSCEGDAIADVKAPYVDNMVGYMNHGGRVFLDHFHKYWVSTPAELRNTASYVDGINDLPSGAGNETAPIAVVDTSFAKGAALADWLVLTGASTTRGQLALYEGQHSVTAVNPPTQSWIRVDSNPNDNPQHRPSIQYMTFNTPVTATPENQCGRVVFTDIHMRASVPDPAGGPNFGGDTSAPGTPFPNGCTSTGLSPQAKALEFMFFDLSACVTPADTPPPVPPPAGVPAAAPVPAPPPPPPPPPPPR